MLGSVTFRAGAIKNGQTLEREREKLDHWGGDMLKYVIKKKTWSSDLGGKHAGMNCGSYVCMKGLFSVFYISQKI